VNPIAVHNAWLVQTGSLVIEADFHGQAPDIGRNLGHCHQLAYIDNFVSSEDENWPAFASDVRYPDFASSQMSLQASASVQKESGRSGCCRYASRSFLAKAARTASATPLRAAAEIFMPSRLACVASSSSRQMVVRVDIY
jgi:hypothetical protein